MTTAANPYTIWDRLDGRLDGAESVEGVLCLLCACMETLPDEVVALRVLHATSGGKCVHIVLLAGTLLSVPVDYAYLKAACPDLADTLKASRFIADRDTLCELAVAMLLRKNVKAGSAIEAVLHRLMRRQHGGQATLSSSESC